MWLVEKSGRTLAGAVQLKDKGGGTLSAPYPFSMYHGVLLDGDLSALAPHRRYKEGLERITKLLSGLESHYSRLSFCLHPNLDDLRAFSWFHYHERERGMFEINPYYTGIVDLGMPDFETYLETIRSCKRREYRLAQKNGVTTEVSQDVDLLEQLYTLTFQRQGMSKDEGELGLLRAIAEAAITHEFGELLLVRLRDGTVASATLFLHDAHTGYYLIGANHPEHRNSFSGVFGVIESFRRCHARGLKRIDVCGINSPNRGDFKIALNAAPTPYFSVNWQNDHS